MGLNVSWRYSSSTPFHLELLSNEIMPFSVLHLLQNKKIPIPTHCVLTGRKSRAVVRCSWVCASSVKYKEVKMSQLWKLRGNINHYRRWLKFCWKTACTATVLTLTQLLRVLLFSRFIIRKENPLRARKAHFSIPETLQGLFSLRPAVQSGEAGDVQMPVTLLWRVDECFLNSSLTDENQAVVPLSFALLSIHLGRLLNEKISDRAVTALATQV